MPDTVRSMKTLGLIFLALLALLGLSKISEQAAQSVLVVGGLCVAAPVVLLIWLIRR